MHRIGTCLFALTLAGCATWDAELLKNHVVAANAAGDAIDALGDNEVLADPEAAFAAIFAAADAACGAACGRPGAPDQKRKLLIHVHGGLNTIDDALVSATHACRAMAEETSWDDWHYPVFLVWPSDITCSYWQSLTTFRRGEHRPWVGALTLPFVFAADVLTAIARAPKNLAYMLLLDGGTALESVDWNSFPTWRRARHVAKAAADEGFQVALGAKDRSGWHYAGRAAAYVATLPAKLVSELVIDAFGTQGFEVMLHRCHNTFRRPIEYTNGNGGTFRADPSGAFGRFFAALNRHIAVQKAAGVEYEVTLVGHSMGAIVLNEALRVFPDLPLDDVVYMAPACTIHDAHDAVVPLLRRQPEARFFVVTLHPLAEAGEAQWDLLDLPARGSLLEWIDNWFAEPISSSHRVLGKWVNAVLALHLFEPVKDRVFLRGYGFDGVPPQVHGEFNDCAFWRRSFWWDGPTREPAALRTIQ